ncbi:VTC domain-containing protein [Haliangium sp.]|uniref:VTC domain-containing protein n=1 Tax=Haliangium sp. TaxID=2663208 RepID=UPI003D11CECB
MSSSSQGDNGPVLRSVLAAGELPPRREVPTTRQPVVGLGEYELKYSLAEPVVSAFLDAVAGRLHAQVYDVSHPVAYARTTYLDTDDCVYLGSSGEPISRRVRIRQYAAAVDAAAPPQLTGQSFVEYKQSSAGQRRKIRLPIDDDEVSALLSGGTLSVAGRRALAEEGGLEALRSELTRQPLTPQLTTWYQRRSLLDEPAQIRVTVDTEIGFYRPIEVGGHKQARPLGPALGRMSDCMLEIKYRGRAPRWLTDALSILGEPPEKRLSKYLMGMQAIGRAAAPEDEPATAATTEAESASATPHRCRSVGG